jgi:hypothetical protein
MTGLGGNDIGLLDLLLAEAKLEFIGLYPIGFVRHKNYL